MWACRWCYSLVPSFTCTDCDIISIKYTLLPSPFKSLPSAPNTLPETVSPSPLSWHHKMNEKKILSKHIQIQKSGHNVWLWLCVLKLLDFETHCSCYVQVVLRWELKCLAVGWRRRFNRGCSWNSDAEIIYKLSWAATSPLCWVRKDEVRGGLVRTQLIRW